MCCQVQAAAKLGRKRLGEDVDDLRMGTAMARDYCFVMFFYTSSMISTLNGRG